MAQGPAHGAGAKRGRPKGRARGAAAHGRLPTCMSQGMRTRENHSDRPAGRQSRNFASRLMLGARKLRPLPLGRAVRERARSASVAQQAAPALPRHRLLSPPALPSVHYRGQKKSMAQAVLPAPLAAPMSGPHCHNKLANRGQLPPRHDQVEPLKEGQCKKSTSSAIAGPD